MENISIARHSKLNQILNRERQDERLTKYKFFRKIFVHKRRLPWITSNTREKNCRQINKETGFKEKMSAVNDQKQH
jgi:hypothetical protein